MNKIYYIHYLRGVAAFFIVLIHCNLFFTNSNSIVAKVYSHFLTEWTAVFILISGFLFQYLIQRYNQIHFLRTKFYNVILPYLIISIPAILIYALGFKDSHSWVDIDSLKTHSYLYIFAYFYITGSHLGPLWFIPVLAMIFAFSKVLYVVGKNEKLLLLLALLSIPSIILTSRPLNDSNAIISFVHFLPVYVLGMYLSSIRDRIISRRFLFVYVAFYTVFFVAEVYFGLHASYSIITKLFLFLSLCSFFITYGDSNNSIVLSLISKMADISFALYFLHGYFVGFLRIVIDKYDIAISMPLYSIFLSIFSAVFISLVVYFIYFSISCLNLVPSRVVIGS